jgi:hypothetical protein
MTSYAPASSHISTAADTCILRATNETGNYPEYHDLILSIKGMYDLSGRMSNAGVFCFFLPPAYICCNDGGAIVGVWKSENAADGDY